MECEWLASRFALGERALEKIKAYINWESNLDSFVVQPTA